MRCFLMEESLAAFARFCRKLLENKALRILSIGNRALFLHSYCVLVRLSDEKQERKRRGPVSMPKRIEAYEWPMAIMQ